MVNFSSRQFTKTELSVLEKGLNVAPALRSIPVPQIVAAVEIGLQRTKASQVEKEAARNTVVGILNRPSLPRATCPRMNARH